MGLRRMTVCAVPPRLQLLCDTRIHSFLGGYMPTYHYRCKQCGYDFTEHQSFDDPAITVCPKCAQETVIKVFSAVPISFKGSGFYRTDSGKH
ncbi:putative regulatory protein (CxxC_CxxC_SSSS) [Bifidobacterium gallicum DSM 20093 = LMG 11596]|nr:putative regulatory protein (CxxC_CxxC_SSSS) [Bifidobacterium gallicum DSM 20093 = LMG 11596]